MRIEYLLLLMMPVLVTAGQVLLKKNLHSIITDKGFSTMIISLLKPGIFIAAACIMVAPILYIKALRYVPLSEAFAFNSLNYVVVFFAGRFILGEKVTPYRVAGVALIAAGFLLPFLTEVLGA